MVAAKGNNKKPDTHGNKGNGSPARKQIRYAVVGLGHISQVAALPAFSHANKNSKLVALVSDNSEKLKKLAKKYGVSHTYSYDQFEECLNSGEIDAVFIGLPNDMHRDFSTRAAKAGIHVLCEKPMAVTEKECQEMIRAASEHHVKLMIAYRLHLEEANLKAVEIVQSEKLGEPRFFNSTFSFQVQEDNIRLDREKGGGTLFDIGIYCINAARYLFRDEPIEVTALSAKGADPRFKEVDEMTSAILRFPGEKLATFTCSFGATDTGMYQIVGTKGSLQVDSAFSYKADIKHKLTLEGKTKERTFPKRDQFAAEILYFSDCIQKDKQPEPSGEEGLADLRIIRALYKSAETGKAVKLEKFEKRQRPSMKQEIKRPPVEESEEIGVEGPTKG